MTEPFDLVRVALVIVAALAQAVMASWPQLRGWEKTVPERSERQHLPIVPWAPFFTIWAVIFAASFGFAVWHTLNPSDPLMRALGWLAVAAWTLNTAWEWHVARRDIDWTSVGLIAAALVTLLAAVWTIAVAGPLSGWAFWLGAAPLLLLAGWISAATWVNLGSTLKWSGVAVRTDWQLALLGAAGALGTIVAWSSGALIYAGAIAWALAGIVVQNLVRDRNVAIGASAATLIPVVLGAALAGG
ncbi:MULTISPECIES: hypothetical protein [unclassified Sphingomonas]|jgi:hypothetical protein|uniref:hypothetical protein n=1 Tax=unclassified Sphingomonas TaxID=196159 RepID=UPI000835C758|nr:MULTISPECIES: hypothetical protein [unclassified Sphingomonas]